MEVTDFNAIYNKYYELVFNYIHNKINTHYQLSEDITSFVFMKLWEQSPPFKSEKHIGVWLIKCASNKIVDTFRAAEFKYRSNIRLQDIDIPDSISTEQLIIDRNTLSHIFNLEKKLPPRQKELFELYFIQELPSKDVAEILNTYDQNIRNQVRTLRQKIKANLFQI